MLPGAAHMHAAGPPSGPLLGMLAMMMLLLTRLCCYCILLPRCVPKCTASPPFRFHRMHPGNFGHQALAELLAQPLIRAVWEAEAGEAVYVADRRPEPRVAGLPPPMIPGNQDSTPGFCAMLASACCPPQPSPLRCSLQLFVPPLFCRIAAGVSLQGHCSLGFLRPSCAECYHPHP